MNYKDYNTTRADRLEMQGAIEDLRSYIMALKRKDLGCIKCEECGTITDSVDIHHTSYKPDITYYDLQLLCWPCHKKTIGFNRL